MGGHNSFSGRSQKTSSGFPPHAQFFFFLFLPACRLLRQAAAGSAPQLFPCKCAARCRTPDFIWVNLIQFRGLGSRKTSATRCQKRTLTYICNYKDDTEFKKKRGGGRKRKEDASNRTMLRALTGWSVTS